MSAPPPTTTASSGSGGLLRALTALDMNAKVSREASVRTKGGAALSLLSLGLSLALLSREVAHYLEGEVTEKMEVDALRNASLRINFDVSFPGMPCAVVSLDAMDASGHTTLDILHDVFKQRLDGGGTPIGEREKGEANAVTNKETLLAEKQRAIAQGRLPPSAARVTGAPAPASAAAANAAAYCGDCYGAAPDGTCCNTCEEVRTAYRRKGWQFAMETVEQCKKEGYYGDMAAQLAAGEGCNIYGHVEVPRVAGNIHFAPGRGVQHAYSHMHDLLSFPPTAFNISHRIHSLSFGPYFPGAGNPLDGAERTLTDSSGMHQYFVKLVPTLYEPLPPAPPVSSHQFSVTEHLKRMDAAHLQSENNQGMLPGVFINYELSPLRMRIVEERRSFLHLLTRVCAIVGGVFTVMGILDTALYRLQAGGKASQPRSSMLGGLL